MQGAATAFLKLNPLLSPISLMLPRSNSAQTPVRRQNVALSMCCFRNDS